MACQLCETLATLPAEAVIYDDGRFIAFQLFHVAGWVVLGSKAHLEEIDGLSETDAAAFGSILRKLAGAVKAATGAERAHLVYLGEHGRHFHISLLPRRSGESALFGSETLYAAAESQSDASKSAEVGAAVRKRMALRDS